MASGDGRADRGASEAHTGPLAAAHYPRVAHTHRTDGVSCRGVLSQGPHSLRPAQSEPARRPWSSVRRTATPEEETEMDEQNPRGTTGHDGEQHPLGGPPPQGQVPPAWVPPAPPAPPAPPTPTWHTPASSGPGHPLYTG